MSNGDTPKLELIGTTVASIIVITFSILVLTISIGSASVSGVPQVILITYAFVVSLSIVQVVGTDVLRAYRSAGKSDE